MNADSVNKGAKKELKAGLRENFSVDRFFLLQSDKDLLVSEMPKNGGHRHRFREKKHGKLA